VKRIITLAVVLAALIPAMMVAQTPSFKGYDEYTKTDIVEWIKDGIDAGYVQFDTPQHEQDFLGVVQQILAARDAGNWSAIVTLADRLETAAGYIVGESHQSLAESLSQILAEVYSSPGIVLLIDTDQKAGITGKLMQLPDTLAITCKICERHIDDTDDPLWCLNWDDDEGGRHHMGICDHKYVIYTDE
jgi:hypothetical protein